MTDPGRMSTGTKVKVTESIVSAIRGLIVGIMLFVPGFLWFWSELQDARGPAAEVHIGHISMAAGLMILAGISINPPWGDKITAIYIKVFPNGIPMLGGRRATDPQPTEPEVKP